MVILTSAQQSPAQEYVDEKYVAVATGLSRKTLQDWRYRGGGPPFVKLSNGLRGGIRYHWPTVKNWLDSRTRFNTGRD